MDRDCPEFERRREKLETLFTDEERRAWEVHLAGCPACRSQWSAEEALRDLFSETEPPELSSRFQENLRQRIAAEPKARTRRLNRIMQVYWLAAAFISAVILFNMKGFTAPEGLTAAMLLLICFTVPILLLGFKLRFGLFDLILSTMTPLEMPNESYRNGAFS